MHKFINGISWQTKLVTILSACAICFALGWRVHGWKTDSSVIHTIAKQEKTRQILQQDQAKIVADGDKQEEADRAKFSVIREKINDQNDQSICFNAESLKLWNDAIGANADSYRRRVINETGSTEAATGESKEPERPNSEYVATVEQVLINAAENFETCTRNTNNHLALIEAVRGINDKMCVCSD
ncbi:hypothetical protein [Methylophilus sp.]|uniref:hypothetical protein n=1 Tax=Methylophilus sp. TaxID=29541 RepID=UPI000D43A952|nr:hypothetical protein [Methylophilus sp.]PPD12175.1 MAG: hypothetical protein CTY26_06175 [Methylophilus sp.]